MAIADVGSRTLTALHRSSASPLFRRVLRCMIAVGIGRGTVDSWKLRRNFAGAACGFVTSDAPPP